MLTRIVLGLRWFLLILLLGIIPPIQLAFAFQSLPDVTISGGGTINEGSTATITLNRSIASPSPLIVNLALFRNDSMIASDYTLTGGSISGQSGNVTVTIPAGQSSTSVVFSALVDTTAAEPEETLLTEIVSGTGYTYTSGTGVNTRIRQNGLLVTSGNNQGEGTLYQAVLNANADGVNSTITFSGVTTVNLSGQLYVANNGSLLIEGGSGVTIQRVSGVFGIFEIANSTVVTLNNLIIQNGNSNVDGGAVRAGYSSVLTLNNCTVTNNAAHAYGGGIFSYGTVTVNNSVISHNRVTVYDGGGIYVNGGTLTVNNSAFYGNSAPSGRGGGITYVTASPYTINNSTISGNTAATGGGLYVHPYGSYLYLNNSIVADNLGGGDCYRGAGTVTARYSLVEDGSCITVGANGNLSGDPALSTLHIPLPGSGVINAGDPVFASVGTDVRGASRVRDGRVDIGAYEVGTVPTVAISGGSSSVSEGGMTTFTFTRVGSLIDPLTVHLNITRSFTTPETEYTLAGGAITGQAGSVTVTIPAGESSVDVTLSAALDDEAEAAHVIALSITADAAYDRHETFYRSASATILVGDTLVTNLNDSGDGSLRQAISNANSDGIDSTISFAVSGTITVLSQLIVNSDYLLIIDGHPSGTTISGGGTTGVLFISGGDVTINRVTITRGASATQGGGIESWGALTLNSSVVSESTAVYGGGGIIAYGLTLNNSTVSGNTNGGIIVRGTAVLNNSIIANTIGGADCYNDGGSVSASYTLIEGGLSCVTVNLGGNRTGDPGLQATLEPGTGSPVINAGDPAFTSLGTDVRGMPRVQGGRVDMGAFESPGVGGLEVHVLLQGRPAAPNAQWSIPLDVTITTNGGQTTLYDQSVTTDIYGHFNVASLPTGFHRITVDGAHTLVTQMDFTQVEGTNIITVGPLNEGDADQDNRVSLYDFSLLAAAFATSEGSPGYNPAVDFNGNHMIDLSDFSLLSSNFGEVGG